MRLPLAVVPVLVLARDAAARVGKGVECPPELAGRPVECADWVLRPRSIGPRDFNFERTGEVCQLNEYR